MITKEDIDLYNKNVGPLNEKDVPQIIDLIKRHIELSKKWNELQTDIEKMSDDSQIALKVFMLDGTCLNIALKKKIKLQFKGL